MSDPNQIKSDIFAAIETLLGDLPVSVSDETPLIGGNSLLNSMSLVELCLTLEDKAAVIGFDFDWTSDAAMSKSRSMFRTAGYLAAEFISQMKAQQ